MALTGGHPANPDPSSLHDVKKEYDRTHRELLRAVASLGRLEVSRVRREAALSHPIRLGKVYMPQWFEYRTPEFHWEITELAMRSNRFVVAAPVGSGKTILLTKLLPVWSALAEDVSELLLISNSNEMASGWLDEMRIMMDSSREFLEDFGDVRGTHWGSSELEFLIPWKGSKRRCVIKARGKGCAIRGLHPDRIIVDDPQDEESVRSDKQRDDFDDWFRGALLTRLDTPRKKLCFIGTAITDLTYIVGLIQNPPAGYVTRAYSILDEQGKSIFPDKFPEEELARRRAEMGEAKFMADFMNLPLRNTKGRRFDISKVKTSLESWRAKSYGSVCLDPSFTVGGDPWGLTLVEQTEHAQWHVHVARAEATGTGPMLQALWDLWEQEQRRISVIGIEIGASQNSLMYLIQEQERQKRTRLPIVWLKHTMVKTKEQRIELLAPIVETGRLSLHPGLTDLRQELLTWRSGDRHATDNLIDSLAMHLEVQRPRSPVYAVERTRQDELRARYQGIRKVMERYGRKTEKDKRRLLPGEKAVYA